MRMSQWIFFYYYTITCITFVCPFIIRNDQKKKTIWFWPRLSLVSLNMFPNKKSNSSLIWLVSYHIKNEGSIFDIGSLFSQRYFSCNSILKGRKEILFTKNQEFSSPEKLTTLTTPALSWAIQVILLIGWIMKHWVLCWKTLIYLKTRLGKNIWGI